MIIITITYFKRDTQISFLALKKNLYTQELISPNLAKS